MADFSCGINALSGRAKEFIKNHVDDGDGLITSAERNKLAEYLNGTQALPEEYEGVREELEDFGRQFDVGAAGNRLYPEERQSVEFRGMSDKDMQAIDSITDYETMKAIADGTLSGFTELQRKYAQALLNNSQYARLKATQEENGALKIQNQALLAENAELKAQIDARKKILEDGKNITDEISKVKEKLNGGFLDPRIKSFIDQSKLSKELNSMDSINNEIINTGIDQNEFIEKFKNGDISEATLNKALKTGGEKMNALIKDFEEKQEAIKEEVANLTEKLSETQEETFFNHRDRNQDGKVTNFEEIFNYIFGLKYPIIW